MEGCSLRQAALKLACRSTAAPATGKQLVTRKSMPLRPLGFTLRGIDTAHPCLVARGIETATAEQFGIGFYRGSGMIRRELPRTEYAGWVLKPFRTELEEGSPFRGPCAVIGAAVQ